MTPAPVIPSPALLFPQPVADQARRLAGLCWICSDWRALPSPESIAPLSDWHALAQQAPQWTVQCAVQSPAGALADTWAATGWQPLSAADCLQDDGNTRTPPSPATPHPASPRWVRGHWYLHQAVSPSAAQAASRQRALQLLQLVTHDADTHELEDAFRQDAALAYQLLRMVNSAAVGSRREITSFGQAILMLGRQALKRWLNLLLFAARDDDPRSAMLLAHVSLRARGMELLAQAAGLDKAMQDLAFMTGMFSLLGVLFGQPVVEVLRPLRIPDTMRDAILEHTGELGELLQTWQAVEHADAAATARWLAHWGVEPADYHRLALSACHWMLQLHPAHPSGTSHGS